MAQSVICSYNEAAKAYRHHFFKENLIRNTAVETSSEQELQFKSRQVGALFREYQSLEADLKLGKP